ncbi:MAG: conjugal transfer protein TraF, partial [Bacteroidota bacterium]
LSYIHRADEWNCFSPGPRHTVWLPLTNVERRAMKTTILCTTILMLIASSMSAQTGGGYFVNRTLPDTLLFRIDPFTIPITVNHEDVKAIGMGKSQVANGSVFNAMMYNPALLARTRTDAGIIVQASLPPRSFTAIRFLADHFRELKAGTFVKQIRQGARNFKTALNIDGQLAALREIQSGIRFVKDLQDAVGGTAANPETHGISIIPSIQGQIGNFGLALYGVAQSGFQLNSGAVLPALVALTIPERLEDLTPETPNQLLAILDPLFDQNGDIRTDALPEAYALSYIDIVGVAGYGFQINPDLSIGANIKVANRRFSTKYVSPDQYDGILSEVRKDFKTSATSVSLDLGALYKFKGTGTEVGLSLQNIIPFKVVTSTIKIKGLGIVDYDRQNGQPIIQNGDTALVAQNYRVDIPFDLKTPILVNIGARQPITDRWDAGLDVVDVAGQDDKFETVFDRVRVGTEFRLDAIQNMLGIAFRVGLADTRPTFGLGLNIFRAVQLDGAYAYDNFFGDNTIFAQVRIGW